MAERGIWSQTVGPLVGGVILGSLVMVVFELVNSLIYPLPPDLDRWNQAAVHAHTASLPWTAYILVWGGYAAGSTAGGYLVAFLSRERAPWRSMALGVFFMVMGCVNMFLLGLPPRFMLLALPTFLLFTLVGHRIARVRQVD